MEGPRFLLGDSSEGILGGAWGLHLCQPPSAALREPALIPLQVMLIPLGAPTPPARSQAECPQLSQPPFSIAVSLFLTTVTPSPGPGLWNLSSPTPLPASGAPNCQI